ncbi:tyrosine-protein kinase [Pedobacter sp. SYSU D00535]|uniref:GumC family protein n=1 Tax=Pedobacter sp. SYSU D00535 TaxID=2810308 RepID=UPI001A95CD26|nr:tyrosine-protein kinase [Pedobacter sp. SYSU D00535]
MSITTSPKTTGKDSVAFENATHMPEKKISYAKVARVFLAGWYWIIGSLVLAVGVAYFYLRTAPRIYSTSSVIRIESDKPGFNLDPNNAPVSLFRPKNDLESETFVIRSRAVMENAIKRLNYQVSYFIKGRVRNSDIYPEVPFSVVPQDTTSMEGSSDLFEFEHKTQTTYLLSLNNKSASFKYGELVELGGYKFKILQGVEPVQGTYLFRINTPASVARSVMPYLTIQPYSKNADIISLSLSGLNPQFASDMLNAIMEEYINHSRKSKQQAATQTIEFINEQLALLSGQVEKSESALESYKRGNNIVDLSTSTGTLVSRLSELESRKNEIQIQSLAIDQLESEIKQNRQRVTLNLGLEGETGPLLTGLVSQFNGLITERNALLNQYNENSNQIKQIDNQIAAIQQAAVNSIRLLRERSNKTLGYVNQQLAELNQELKEIPRAERQLFSLTANNEVNQKVLTFLNEKKLAAQINRASTVADASIIETAKANLAPISPKSADIYRNSLVFGLALGIGIILLLRMINPYINDRAFVEAHTNVPILGVIRKFPDTIDENNSQVLNNVLPKSVFAESVRSVRTNLSFLAAEKGNKVICVTSELAGEGKSFTSLNLASTLALIEKRVVLIAADLRRSKLHKAFNVEKGLGLADFLARKTDLEHIITKTSLPELDFISSGTFPPNPSELLHSDRMQDLIKRLSETYDYVIVDTAPVGIISDAIPIITAADINIFVVRAGVSKTTAATLPTRISYELGLNNAVIILNEFEEKPMYASFYSTDFGETGYYGYYYYSDYSAYSSYLDVEKKPWWKRIFKV